MKKLIFLLAAILAFSVNAGAQKKSKEDKAAAETAEAAKLALIMNSKKFEFNPNSVQPATAGASVRIVDYQYMRVSPDFLQIDMAKLDGRLSIETTAFEITKSERVKDTWMTVIKAKSGAQYTFTIKVNLKNNLTTVRVDSNNEDSFIYNGKIRIE